MIRSQLFAVDPYVGFNARAFARDMQGWESDHRYLPYAVERARPSAILEVGSWKGRSAINMARAARKLNLSCEVVCVDTWLGSPEHWLEGRQNGWFDDLLIENGYPRLYRTFLANVVGEGFQDMITPLAMTSENAAVVLSKVGAQFDVMYIDAAHEYEPVLRDLRSFWPLLRDPGILVGDDFHWKTVQDAARDFAREVDTPLYEEAGKFMLGKGSWTPPLADAPWAG